MSVLSTRALYQLLSYPLIQPIGAARWYKPLARVAGAPGAGAAFHPDQESPLAAGDVRAELERVLLAQRTHALLVLHQGRLVQESYGRYSATHVSNSKSMMKTVLALLIGMAEAEGRLDVAQPAADFLPEWRNDRRRHITIEHLLTMHSGLRSDLSVPGRLLLPDVVPLYLGTHLEWLALSVPAVAAPGQYWEYNNTNSQVLGIVLSRAVGMPYQDYLSQRLWQPLGCADAAVWLDKPDGIPRTFAGLFARPHDWLRVGELIRQRGQWQGRELLPARWFERMETPRNRDADYGYHLWLKAHRVPRVRGIPAREHFLAHEDFLDPDTIYLEGMHAQSVLISRRHGVVALRIGEKPRQKSWDNSFLINTLLRRL